MCATRCYAFGETLLFNCQGADLSCATVTSDLRWLKRGAKTDAFTEIEAPTFLLLLNKFVVTFNSQIRKSIHLIED
jgi:hypothetical protein